VDIARFSEDGVERGTLKHNERKISAQLGRSTQHAHRESKNKAASDATRYEEKKLMRTTSALKLWQIRA